MRSEGAAPRPAAPLCGALSLVLGALLGKGKAGAGVVPGSPGGGGRGRGLGASPAGPVPPDSGAHRGGGRRG